MPNLIADRPGGVRSGSWNLNVRRLMYQSLIWLVLARDDAGRLGSTVDAQRLKSKTDALIDGMR
ncbi:MAG TPA: hypothetical protein VJ775_01175 [Sphingomicrobium sp.]|nr:hypothetical protein [Sphingomicrobium sp.]